MDDPNHKRRAFIWPKGIRALYTAAAYALVFLAADFALNRFAFTDGWTILWPLNGAIIALLLMRPRSSWPILLLGIQTGIGVGEYLDGNSAAQEILLRFASLVEVVLSALLLPAFSDLPSWLRRPQLFPRFLAALVLGPALSGLMAARLFQITEGKPFLTAFDGWACADALGIAAILPLALALRTPEMRDLFRPANALRTLTVLAVAFAGAAVALSVGRYPLLFLLYPSLLLADSLLAFAGSSIAVAGIAFLSVYLATHGIGPFSAWPPHLAVSRDVALQLYLGFHLVALFPASIIIMERKRMATELRDNNAQLLLLASLDGLTGIPNRRSHEEHFTQEWNRAIRLDTPLALIMIDIDQFKQFNDLYGHHAGDRCLQTVATAVAAEMRRGQDHASRFGGEEFAILLPHTDLEGARHVAESIRLAVLALQLPHRAASDGLVTISLGCAAITPVLGLDRDLLFKMADAALYDAKRGGRNRTASFEMKPSIAAMTA